jgi:hypothetical protein
VRGVDSGAPVTAVVDATDGKAPSELGRGRCTLIIGADGVDAPIAEDLPLCRGRTCK